MKWADQFCSLPNQSNFHEMIREILCEDKFFSNLRCYQEVSVQELIPEYHTNQHRFDWYIQELNTILELHGQQHYKATSFGAQSYEKTQRSFSEGQARDNLKMTAAIDAGYKYRVISFKEITKLDSNYLKTILLKRE